jgi:hypothetical protein
MEKTFLFCMVIFIFALSATSQYRYGLLLDNTKIIQPKDTISLTYPSGSAIIFCEIFDANNTVISQPGVAWSLSGNLTVLDTPLITPRIVIIASNALTDEKGYLIARALDSGEHWICDRVFIRVKGKNSGVLRGIVFPETQNHDFRNFDIAGRLQGGFPGMKRLCIFKQPSTIIILHDAAGDKGEKIIHFR